MLAQQSFVLGATVSKRAYTNGGGERSHEKPDRKNEANRAAARNRVCRQDCAGEPPEQNQRVQCKPQAVTGIQLRRFMDIVRLDWEAI